MTLELMLSYAPTIERILQDGGTVTTYERYLAQGLIEMLGGTFPAGLHHQQLGRN